MSIVSEFKLELPSADANHIIAYAVSNTSTHAMVAVAMKKKVVFFGENGQMNNFMVSK